MPLDMKMEYTYKKNVSIRVSLTENYDDPLKNYIEIEFSGSVKEYFTELGWRNFSNISPGQRDYAEKQLSQLFNDPYETVFIPAGAQFDYTAERAAQLYFYFAGGVPTP